MCMTLTSDLVADQLVSLMRQVLDDGIILLLLVSNFTKYLSLLVV